MSKAQSHYQIYGNEQRPYPLHDRNGTYNVSEQDCKLNEKLYNISCMGKVSEVFAKHFWKEHTFWTDGYFACSVGNVSEEILKRYIENQG